MTTSPHELDILKHTVALADRMARRGEVVDGHCELVYGLRRAENVAGDGGAGWGLVTSYRTEILAFCDRWGVVIR